MYFGITIWSQHSQISANANVKLKTTHVGKWTTEVPQPLYMYRRPEPKVCRGDKRSEGQHWGDIVTTWAEQWADVVTAWAHWLSWCSSSEACTTSLNRSMARTLRVEPNCPFRTIAAFFPIYFITISKNKFCIVKDTQCNTSKYSIFYYWGCKYNILHGPILLVIMPLPTYLLVASFSRY